MLAKITKNCYIRNLICLFPLSYMLYVCWHIMYNSRLVCKKMEIQGWCQESSSIAFFVFIEARSFYKTQRSLVWQVPPTSLLWGTPSVPSQVDYVEFTDSYLEFTDLSETWTLIIIPVYFKCLIKFLIVYDILFRNKIIIYNFKIKIIFKMEIGDH